MIFRKEFRKELLCTVQLTLLQTVSYTHLDVYKRQILSSNDDLAISEKYCFAGEIGLSGEIRPVPQIEQRISEAEKLGYDKIFVSNLNKIPKRKFGIKIEEVSKIEEFHEKLF